MSQLRTLETKQAVWLALKLSVALGVVLLAGVLLPLATADASPGPIVQTHQGPVQGFFNDHVAKFLGIPYAAPPLSTDPSAPPCSPGNLRWCPPVAHAPWRKLRQATSFGSNCPQSNENGGFAGPVNTTNEDCLFLNVFTPAIGTKGLSRGKNRKLPVIFFIHGGGNMDGESNDYDGSRLAVRGNVVVVTINYRLGPLGWLAVPALDSEGHLFANYGLLDQQFAAKWVHQNIARFGGDPQNVTVGGQSAGSWDTIFHVVSPLSKGLFDRAIFMSTHQTSLLTPLQTAEAQGTAFTQTAGCTAANGDTTNSEVATCLRSLSPAQVLAQARGLQGIGDGTILPLQPSNVSPTQPGGIFSAIESGHYNHMPIMAGNTLDEEAFFLAASEEVSQTPVSASTYAAAIAAFPTTVTPFTAPLTVQEWVSEHYPLVSSTPPGPELSLDRLDTDQFQCGHRRLFGLISSGPSPSPLYAYDFEDRTAPFYFAPLSFPFESLAYHTSDLQYVFGNTSMTINFHGGPAPPTVITPLNPEQKVLADQMVKAWTNFAWTGNPNTNGAARGGGQSSLTKPWPRYQGSAGNSRFWLENVASAGGISTTADAAFAAQHNCAFWDTVINQT